MTAEIAILNRRAVTLAADSAMTITREDTSDKVYNTADKIFELSAANPIALMVYNNLDYMGYPLDLLIKRFRESPKCRSFDHVFDASGAFFSFLHEEFPVSPELEQEHAANVVDRMLRVLNDFFQRNFSREYSDATPKKRRRQPSEIFVSSLKALTEALSEDSDAEALADVTVDEIIQYHEEGLSTAINRRLFMWPLDDDDKNLVKRFGALVLKKSPMSSIRTGLVFCGFGQSQLFPAMQSFEFDGLIMGRQKLKETQRVEIGPADRSAIIPFAQREMVDRFIFGIDYEFEDAVLDSIDTSVRTIGSEVVKLIPKLSHARKKEVSTLVDRSIDEIMRDLKDKTLNELREKSKEESESAVSVMAKSDLANFAEALVQITSIKRRASLEQETVGGPIDVAVISKDDGFVWVKRKHYFDGALNPRYFFRKYGSLMPSGGGVK